MRIQIAALMAFFCLSSPPAIAQQQAATTTPPATVDVIAVPVWPMQAVQLADVQPTEASFSLGRIEGVAPELLSGVTAKGYARKVAVENQSIGQVLVVSVAKGDREETISAEGLTAQFDAKETSQLFPEKTFDVQGSKTALIAALKRLAETKPKEEKTTTKDDVTQNPASGSSGSNDEAAAYRSPSITAAPAEADAEPVVEVRITSEGCPVRIDLVQGRAFRQSKEQTFTDGVLSSEGQCSDSEFGFPLAKSYLACPVDILDLAAMKAWPQYQTYYLDDAGENHPVGECQQDKESVYTIVEDEGQCPIFLDFAESKAVPQAALVYVNRNGATVQARGCDVSTKSPASTMTENVSNCPIRHDYGAGLSYELSMWTYMRDGVTYQAAPCADTGRTFAHQIVYADDSGNYICTPIINMTTRTATLQSRKRITIDGSREYITDCTPDTSAQSIQATTDTCMDPSKWTHDLNASLSYGQERFYYLKADATRTYVSDCQTSAVTYPHHITITGYQYHDDQLWAYPLSTVTITVGGSTYTIASSEVLPGEAQMNYTLSGTVDQPTGASTYSGCTAYRTTARSERWIRPDGTEYYKAIGPGSPITVANICQTNVLASASFETGDGVSKSSDNCSINGDGGGWIGGPVTLTKRTYYQTVKKSEVVNPESGQVVSTSCGFVGSWQGSSSTSSWQMSCQDVYESSPRPYYSARQTFFVPPCPF